jgi:Domain of unknown function (DUF4269)
MGDLREPYACVLERLRILERLSQFEPMPIGTPPLGLAVPGSDIDVACYSPTLEEFLTAATDVFGQEDGFATRFAEWVQPRAAIAVFRSNEWAVELFCQTIPTRQQVGVRHFLIEQRLLALEPGLRPLVLSLKRAGLKTEDAFARTLRLSNPNPYDAVLSLESLDDVSLRRIARDALA